MDKRINEIIEHVKNDKPLEAKQLFREIATSRIATKIETFRRQVAKNFFNKNEK